jgi:hypothetical protein
VFFLNYAADLCTEILTAEVNKILLCLQPCQMVERNQIPGDGAEMVLETLICFEHLTWLMAQEDSIKFSCHENFKSC